MTIKTSKRAFVRTISFICAVVAVLGAFCIVSLVEDKNGTKVSQKTINSYNESFSTLSSSLNNLSEVLRKYPYIHSSYGMTVLSAQVQYESGMAKSALEHLPVSKMNLNNTSKLFAQTGDYIFALVKNRINGQMPTDEENEIVQNLSDKAKKLAEMISDLESNLSDPNAGVNDVLNYFFDDDTKVNPDDYELVQGESTVSADSSYLIYDGAYSDDVFSGKYYALDSKDEISSDEAHDICKKFVKGNEEIVYQGNLDNDNISCYYFNSGTQDIIISKLGGYCVSYSDNRNIGDSTIDSKSAEASAEAYLSQHGYENMSVAYTYADGNIYRITLINVIDDVYCVGDIINVNVAADNGDIVTLDAGPYLRHHDEDRNINFDITEQEARNYIGDFNVSEVRKVVMLSNGGYDKCCYEFTINTEKDETVLIYINAETGNEERVLIVVNDENGKYVI